MTVEITLTIAGADTTVFDLYSDVDGYTSSFETGVPTASLIAGYTTALVPEGTTSIRVQNAGMSCVNYIDILLTTTTTTTSSTTTTSTTLPTVECSETANSGGVGVTEYLIPLSSTGGNIIMDFDALGVPDKLEILHNGLRVATSGMTVANAGPFDELYGDPTVPTTTQVISIDQFIGTSKSLPPNRNAEFLADTGIVGVTASKQQLIWWVYDNDDFTADQYAIVRVTGPDGTGWSVNRICVTDCELTSGTAIEQ